MRDQGAIPYYSRAAQPDGTVCYFFGDTSIRAIETRVDDKIVLTPVSGDQIACGEWVDLDDDEVRQYCSLLSDHLNSRPAGK